MVSVAGQIFLIFGVSKLIGQVFFELYFAVGPPSEKNELPATTSTPACHIRY